MYTKANSWPLICHPKYEYEAVLLGKRRHNCIQVRCMLACYIYTNIYINVDIYVLYISGLATPEANNCRCRKKLVIYKVMSLNQAAFALQEL